MDKCSDWKEHKFSNNQCMFCHKRYDNNEYKKNSGWEKIMLYVFLLLWLFVLWYVCSVYDGSMFYRIVFMVCVYVELVIVFHILVIDKMIQGSDAATYLIIMWLLFWWSIILKLIFNLLWI